MKKTIKGTFKASDLKTISNSKNKRRNPRSRLKTKNKTTVEKNEE